MTGIRVMHVISEMGTGGAESLVMEMVRRGPQVGWESAVASGGGSRVSQLTAAGVPHFFVPVPRRSVRRVFGARMAVRRAVKSFNPDLVIAHNVSATGVTCSARLAVPLLTVFHGVSAPDYRNSARVLLLASDRIVAVGGLIADRLRKAGIRVEVTVIRNAVTQPQPTCRSAAREVLNLPVDAPVALCLARMEPQKRHDLLLDAWSQLSGNEILLLAGDGSLRPNLEQRARNLGDRVRFLGTRSDVPTLLAAADVSVLTSDWEGLPMAILESLSAGRPVVATDVDGVREILAPGGGRLVPPGDARSVALALREMLYDEAARNEAASIGLSTIEQFYDPVRMMQCYDEVIRQMITTRDIACIP